MLPSKTTNRGEPGGNRRQVVHEIGDDAMNLKLGILLGKLLGDSSNLGLADVERNEESQRACALHGIEKDSRLGRGAGPELDELLGSR